MPIKKTAMTSVPNSASFCVGPEIKKNKSIKAHGKAAATALSIAG